MNIYESKEAWFITGSQELYGEEVLKQVAEDSGKIVDGLNAGGKLPIKIVFKPVLKSAEAISHLIQEANAADVDSWPKNPA
jgi:L-arabinose isomerase